MNQPSQATERMELFQRRMWAYSEIKEWFGCDLDSSPQRLLAQYRIWASRYEGNMTVLDTAKKLINRNIFELFLQSRELLAIRSAALRWGMDVSSFEEVLKASLDKDLVTEAEICSDFHQVFTNSFIAGFHRRFPKINRITFSSFNDYVRLLHEAIEDVLEITVTPAYCVTSLALGESPSAFGYNYDCISNEPVGLGHQIWLKTGKPIQLELDGCSWLTMEKYFDTLNGQIVGTLREEFNQNRQALSRYINDNP